MKIDLPLPPSTNAIWRRGKHGGVYLAPAVRAFRDEVAWSIRAAGVKRFEGAIRIVATFHPADKRVFDVDNRIKSLLDALVYADLLEDDRFVTDIHAKKGEVLKPDGKTVLEVYTIR